MEKGFQVLSAFRERGVDVIGGLIKAIRDFDVTPLVNGLTIIASIFSSLYRAIAPTVIYLLPYAGVVFFALAKVLEFLAPALEYIIPLFVGYRIGMLAATAAQWLFNTALTANPIGLVIAGIGLLVAAVIWMVENWEMVSEILGGVWDVIKGGFASLVMFMVKMWMLPIRAILSGAKAVAGLFGVDSDIINGAIKGLDTIENKIKSVLPSESLIDIGVSRATLATVAPNQTDAESRSGMSFNGRLDIYNAPEGSTIKTDATGVGSFDLNLAGVNP